MLIDRREWLRALESCSPGLSTKSGLDQSNCFCAQDNKIKCFSEEIYTEIDFPLGITAAVPAKPLLDTLRKLTEDSLDITTSGTKLRIKGTGRRLEINMNPEIMLPAGSIEQPTKWVELPPAFGDALPMVSACCLETEGNDQFELSCVRITPRGLESCDLKQAIRYAVATGVQGEVLIRGTSAKAFNGLGIAEMSETESWWWIKTYTGLRAAVRKIQGKYPPIGQVFKTEAISTVEVPGSVVEILGRCTPFLQETVAGKLATFTLKPGQLLVRAQNVNGWYEEKKAVDYSGPELTMGLNPLFLEKLIKHGLPITLTRDSVRVSGGEFVFALAIERV